MFFIALLIIFVTLIAFDYSLKRRKNGMIATISGPPCYPIMGGSFIFKIRNFQHTMDVLRSYVAKYGNIFRLWVGWNLIVVITDARALEAFLKSPKYTNKGFSYKLLTVWLGNGLLVSSGRKWFQRRKIITPAFHFKILEEFTEIFDEQGTIMVGQLKPHCGNGSFNITKYVTLAALDIISETAMGTKIYAQTNPTCEYAHAVHDMSNILSTKIIRPYLGYNIIMYILAPKLKRKQDKALKVLHDFTENIIESRRKSLLKTMSNRLSSVKGNLDEFGRKRKMALLDVLLLSTIDEKPLSNADIREEVDTFTFEGHDTTTAGVSFTLYCLSRHPHVQEKVFDEIRKVIGDDKSTLVTLAQLNELKYLDLVIKESMRIYPPVPIIGRMLEVDFEIDGCTIPAGTGISIPIYLIMKDPEIFPNPEQFDPDRFASEVYWEKVNSFAYIPFSAGPRNCIGQKFAMLEMKSIISKVLLYYELLPLGPYPKPFFSMVTRSENGVNLGIRERNYI